MILPFLSPKGPDFSLNSRYGEFDIALGSAWARNKGLLKNHKWGCVRPWEAVSKDYENLIK